MSYRYERYRERPRQSPLRRFLVGLTILVWIILAVLLLARFVARPVITNLVEQRFAERIPILRQPPADPGVGDGGTLPAPSEPAANAPEPGSFTISEADANQWIVDHRHEL